MTAGGSIQQRLLWRPRFTVGERIVGVVTIAYAIACRVECLVNITARSGGSFRRLPYIQQQLLIVNGALQRWSGRSGRVRQHVGDERGR